MDFQLLHQALKQVKFGQKFAFATVVDSTIKGTPRKAGAKMLVSEDGQIFGTIGGGRNEKDAQKRCLKVIKSGKPELVTYDYFGQQGQSVCGGQIRVFIEPYIQSKKFVLCGGGHIGLPLSMILKMMDFDVTVIDNRKEFANAKRFPHADRILCGKYTTQLKKVDVDANTSIMIVTQGNEYDYECLSTTINLGASYLGVISSKAKRIKFFKRLKDQGFRPAQLKRIHIPSGLDIGAQKPSEIAVSIAAEIVQVNNKDLMDTDKFKEKIKSLGL